jgi:hypothetical protein
MAERYLASPDPGAADAFVEVTGLGWDAHPKGVGRLVEVVSGARHRWMYDAESVQRLCRDVGFSGIQECAYREGRCPALERVEVGEDSFFVEASVVEASISPLE